jgi:hypothetical protein
MVCQNNCEVAHKLVDKANWSADSAQQKREIIKILKDMIAELETAPEPEAPAEAGKAKAHKKSKQNPLVFVSPSA